MLDKAEFQFFSLALKVVHSDMDIKTSCCWLKFTVLKQNDSFDFKITFSHKLKLNSLDRVQLHLFRKARFLEFVVHNNLNIRGNN